MESSSMDVRLYKRRVPRRVWMGWGQETHGIGTAELDET